MSQAERAREDGALGWGGVLLCGLLWGGAVGGIEGLVEPLEGMALRRVLAFLLVVSAWWSLTGVGWAAVARLAEPRVPPAGLAAVWAICATLFTTLQAAIPGNVSGSASAVHALLAHDIPRDSLVAHVLWINAFYGGIYLTAYAASRRALRSRLRLRRLQGALQADAARLDESRLRALRERLQPELLVETVTALKARFEHGGADAELLMDRLVSFLRLTVADPRRTPQDVAAELQAAEAYLALRADLDGVSQHRLAEGLTPPPMRLFPSRQLLPLIIRLSRRASQIALSTSLVDDLYAVKVQARGDWDDVAFTRTLLQETPRSRNDPEPGWRIQTHRSGSNLVWILSARTDATSLTAFSRSTP